MIEGLTTPEPKMPNLLSTNALKNTPDKLRVGIILTPNFTLTAFAGFVDAFRLAADEKDYSRKLFCDWEILGADLDAIPSSCGASIKPTATLVDADRYDYVAVVGGLLHGGQLVSNKIYKFLHQAADDQIPLIGLCTGSFILARAGLLDGYLTCVSWFHRDEFVSEFPRCRVTSNQMFVVDRDRLTCAGGTSVVHLAAYVIEKSLGRTKAVKALRIMLEDQPLPPKTLQPEAVLTKQARDPVVHKALLVIEQSLHKPGAISALLNHLEVGTRQLERRFVADIGLSPSAYRLKLRLNRAEWLLKNSALGVTDIALECGFQDGAHFSYVFKKNTGQTPTDVKNRTL